MSVPITINGVVYQAPSSAADTNWAALQLVLEQALATAVNAAVAAPTWLNFASFSNGWRATPATGAGYAKDVAGWVTFRGQMDEGTPGATVLTLPAGYRPAFDVGFPLLNVDGTTSWVTITAAGVLTLSGASSTDGVYLAPIRFNVA